MVRQSTGQSGTESHFFLFSPSSRPRSNTSASRSDFFHSLQWPHISATHSGSLVPLFSFTRKQPATLLTNSLHKSTTNPHDCSTPLHKSAGLFSNSRNNSSSGTSSFLPRAPIPSPFSLLLLFSFKCSCSTSCSQEQAAAARASATHHHASSSRRSDDAAASAPRAAEPALARLPPRPLRACSHEQPAPPRWPVRHAAASPGPRTPPRRRSRASRRHADDEGKIYVLTSPFIYLEGKKYWKS